MTNFYKFSLFNNLYNIKDSKDFTIKGYTITVMSAGTDTEDAKTLFRINVLDKQFKKAVIDTFGEIDGIIFDKISSEEVNRYT